MAHHTIGRRTFLAGLAGTTAFAMRRLDARAQRPPARAVPSPSQLEWQRDEFALFLHFGVNTFTDREWGDGKEDPRLFAPVALDPKPWADAARAAGAKTMILTAKHHDGFCLWPTRTTDHSVKSSPWHGGRGDVVREFVDACRHAGLKPGLYLSPWDRHEPRYGDSPRYNDFYADQLTELLTHYGAIHEVWFDGANGEGPNGKKQQYDWPRVWNLVRKLQPKAVMFSDAGPDVRWIGNENGSAGDPNWSTVDPAVVPYPGVSGNGVTTMLQHGDPNGTVWRPGESDVSIRPGWFHHPAEDARVKTTDRLVNLYLTSVGRNSKLLLNVPPTRDGRLHETDVSRLMEMRTRLNAMFARDLTLKRPTNWDVTGPRTATLQVDLDTQATLAFADLREDITRGQIVSNYAIEGRGEGPWQPLARGSTIGCRKIDRLTGPPVSEVRVTITDALETPRRISLALYA